MRGTPIELSAAANDCDCFVVNSDMKPHYFAGYSNALKFFLPGVTSFAAVEANHALALAEGACAAHHAVHPDAGRRNNPLSADMLEFFTVMNSLFNLLIKTGKSGLGSLLKALAKRKR